MTTPVPPHLSDEERALWETPERCVFERATVRALLTALSTEREAGERRRYRTLRAIALSDSAHWRALDCGDGAFTEAEFDKLVDSAGPETPREAGTTGWPCIYCGKPRTEHRYGGYACPVESGLWAERDYAPNMHQHISFAALVAYGRSAGGNIVNGMPWSFTFNGVPITHENDECYLICGAYPQRFTSRDTLAVGPFGQLVVLYAPTPPSDAGTSERETCPDCPHAPHLGTPCAECRRFGGFRGECSHQGAKGRPAAPAAEGPREKPCPYRVSVGELHDCALPKGHAGRCQPPAAALPGAEAGTPTPMLHSRNCSAIGKYGDDDCTCGLRWRIALTTEQTMHRAWRKRAEEAEVEVAALTSEVRTLREDKARLDWLDERREAIEDVRTVGRQVGDDEWEPEQVRELLGHRWDGIEGQCDTIRAAIDAARLASPSPTGAT